MYTIRKSNRVGKKYSVILPSGREIHFGAQGYQDYTMHKDPKRLENYISRHSAREDWTKNN